ncbi:MAG: biopolymer transporter ExbD [Polyangiaceae bacterium]|nr:biopolymer transporter ExbD [Polyangiaceae bacterium]
MSKLSAAQRGKIRRLSQPKELSPDEEGGELNIVPFLDIIVNILIFVLATVAVTFTSTIETTPPAIGGGGVRSAAKKDALNLTVIVVSAGFSIKASGGNVAPGCSGRGNGISIPKKGQRYDYQGLQKCVHRLKGSNPAFADESQFKLSANPGIEYQVIINVIDALRSTPDGKGVLFDNVSFTMAK